MEDKIKKIIINEISLTLIICLIIFSFAKIFNVVRVSGESMMPTFTPQELVRTTKDLSDIQKGDIIVFNHHKHLIIKRVVATAGDTVQIKDGFLYLNNKKIIEPFDKMDNSGIASIPILIKKDEFFVLGDNRNRSSDSRDIGSIKLKDVSAIVQGKLLSFKNNK